MKRRIDDNSVCKENANNEHIKSIANFSWVMCVLTRQAGIIMKYRVNVRSFLAMLVLLLARHSEKKINK